MIPKDYSRYHFEGQKADEKILLVLHRHWFNILSQFFAIIFMLLLFFISFAAIPLYVPSFGANLGKNLFYFLEDLFLMIVFIIAYVTWIDYYFDVWIVTDRRIVNIEQKGLFARVVSELELENIQDITTDIKGLIPTLLNYGNLFVQTAGEMERFIFRNIPSPTEVKDVIMNLQQTVENKEENEFGEMLKKKIHKETI